MTSIHGGTVLVAGGAGFIGSSVVRELLALDNRVVCFDNFHHGRPEHVELDDARFSLVHGDLLDPWQILRCMERFAITHIIHCAGDTFVPSAYTTPGRFFDLNVTTTLNVLMAARRASVRRIVYLSSTEIYGPSTVAMLDEGHVLNPVNTYAVSKLAADRLCATMCVEHGLPVVIARLFNCYGPRETHPYVIPDIIAQLATGHEVSLGNAESERDFTYVTDTAKALIALLAPEIPDGEVFNVGSGQAHTIAWVAGQLAEIMDVPQAKIRLDQARVRRRDIDRFCCNGEKLRRHTGWRPEVGIADGLRRTVEWFHTNGKRWSWQDLSHDEMPHGAPRRRGGHAG